MKTTAPPTAIWMWAAWSLACSSGPPPPPPEQAGQPCTAAGQCYHDTNGAPLLGGPAVCLDRVPGGYCTHVCTADTDCCAVPGECRTSYPQVCSPFESAGAMYCFLSCEDRLLGGLDPSVYCATYAYAGFNCRSSGGGSLNRKVCTP